MTPGSQNINPLVGGDGGKFFLTQLESQSSAHITPQSANLVDRREYEGGGGGMMSQSMAGLSQNPGISTLGPERYLNTSQFRQRPAPGRRYPNTPISNANVLGGGYPRYGYGNPSSDNMLPVNIAGSVPTTGGRTAEVVDTTAGYAPTYTFRSDGMNAMDSAGAMGLSLSSGMDAGWLNFIRDCGIMDVREDR